MSVVFMTNYFSLKGDITVDNDALLVTDFMNLKIKSTQSFKCGHKDKVCVYLYG
jgi:hypothetical protein